MSKQENRKTRRARGGALWHRPLLAAALMAAVALGMNAQAQEQEKAMTDRMASEVADALIDGFVPEEFIQIDAIEGEPADHLWVTDANFFSMVDGRFNVFDMNSGDFLGLIPLGFNGLAQLSVDGRQVYLATTYFERIFRGERQDLIEIWDAQKLSFIKEIPIPNKRASSLNYDGLFTRTNDGRFVLLQNATPAQSITVVDMQEGKFVEEITATAGCWTANPLPGTERSFTTICGDGAMITVNLDEAGHLTSQSRTEPVFSVKDDPIFVAPGYLEDGLMFISFYGNVYTLRNQGDELAPEPVWSLLNAEDRKDNWVPGGTNLIAVDNTRGYAYIQMHPEAFEGSHKMPAAEIWVFDLGKKERIARVPGNDALSINIVRGGDQPVLAGIDGENVTLYDISGVEPKELRTIEGAANTSLQMISVASRN